MIKNPTIFILGIVLIMIPFVGLPIFWKFFLTLFIGAGLSLSSIHIQFANKFPKRPKQKEKTTKSETPDQFEYQQTISKEPEPEVVKEIDLKPTIKEKPKRVRKVSKKSIPVSTLSNVLDLHSNMVASSEETTTV